MFSSIFSSEKQSCFASRISCANPCENETQADTRPWNECLLFSIVNGSNGQRRMLVERRPKCKRPTGTSLIYYVYMFSSRLTSSPFYEHLFSKFS